MTTERRGLARPAATAPRSSRYCAPGRMGCPITGGFRDLGITALARRLALKDEQTCGHWCSRCTGVWFGCPLEAQCPVCGNRKG